MPSRNHCRARSQKPSKSARRARPAEFQVALDCAMRSRFVCTLAIALLAAAAALAAEARCGVLLGDVSHGPLSPVVTPGALRAQAAEGMAMTCAAVNPPTGTKKSVGPTPVPAFVLTVNGPDTAFEGT